MSEKPLSTPLLHTPSPAAHKLELLRQLFPQAVQTDPDGSVRVDAAQIQRALDPANAQGIRVEETGYELRWVGKQEAYHTAFARTDKIVAPVPADSKAWDSTGNLLMKGDNLDALKLLRQSYFGQVKLIYIDPPYNTKSDEFIYRDDFTARQTDILAQLGYSADNVEYIQNIYGARTHSGWLSFMYPRLLLAKDLLRDDGVIFISIDDNEQAQLKLLCDEVFGQDNFVANIVWHNSSRQSEQVAGEHEYLLAYTKTEPTLQDWTRSRPISSYLQSDIDALKKLKKLTLPEAQEHLRTKIAKIIEDDLQSGKKECTWLNNYKNLDENWKIYYAVDLSGEGDGPPRLFDGKLISAPPGRHWMGQDYINELQNAGRIVWRGDRAYRKLFIEESYENLKSIIRLPTRNGSEEIKEALGKDVFSKPKPIELIKRLIYFSGSETDITLDFFAGSGTTGEAVMRLNAEDGGQRQFILVQIPQPIDPKKQKEAHSFVTQTLGKPEATIFEITAERLRRAGDKINAAQRSQGKPEVDAGFRVYTLADDPHALVHRTPLDQATQADVAALQAAIATPQPEQRPVVLANLLLTEGLPLSATLTPLAAGSVADALWQAQDTLLVLDAVPLDALVDLLRQRKAAGTPVHHVSVYAPWVHDDNFLQGVQTLLEAEGFSADRLRLRG